MQKEVGVLECDYLVIGAGAMGLAFVDELLNQNSNLSVIIVDKAYLYKSL
jgi:L-2-hydroxyglutarate oxidase LhgO